MRMSRNTRRGVGKWIVLSASLSPARYLDLVHADQVVLCTDTGENSLPEAVGGVRHAETDLTYCSTHIHRQYAH